MGIGKFNSDDHCIYLYGQQSRREMEWPSQSTRVWNAVLGCNLKNSRMILVCFQGRPFNITVIQVYATTINAKEDEVKWFYEDLQDLLELTPKKDVLFITEDWNAKKSRDIWSNTQFGPGVQNEAGKRLTDFCQENTLIKHHLPTTQVTTLHVDITRWSTPKSDWLYYLQLKMEKFYTVSKNKTWNWLWLRLWAFYCPNSDLNWRKKGKPLGHSGMTQIKYLRIIQCKW